MKCNLNARKALTRILPLVATLSVIMAVLQRPVSAAVDKYADWCECAIFVVNHLGLDIIPSEYYTAGSFGEPDENGKSWMEYQGFTRLPETEMPQRGDVIVMRTNGRVYVPESAASPRLVSVNAGWAGHIGVIEMAESAEEEGRSFLRITFISSNWGVNATPMFVRSGCYNVDRSVVLVEKGDPDFSVWRQTDPAMQRHHMLNIARQLANGFYFVEIGGKIDGYPVSGPGMIADIWNAEMGDLTTGKDIIFENGSEIPVTSLQDGDVLVDEEGGFYGVFAGFSQSLPDIITPDIVANRGLAYWFNPSGATLQGPASIATIPGRNTGKTFRVYRSKTIHPMLALDGFEIIKSGDGKPLATAVLKNTGGQTLRIDSAGVRITTPRGQEVSTMGEKVVRGIEIPPGQEYVLTIELEVSANGVYLIQPVVVWDGILQLFPEMGKVEHMAT